MSTIGPLIPADETFHHQITDTFATVGQADRSWTEKVCAMACARDGSLQLGFGIGKYPNRNVIDAYAGVSRGVEQWNVRASREIAGDHTTSVGPVTYEVVEPLRAIRFALAPNDIVPIAFDWTFTGIAPPALEQREHHRSRDGARLDADIVRYHHTGTARGWVEIDGERIEPDDATWISTRDHSWGVRYQVGAPVEDVAPTPIPEGVAMLILWCPVLCERPDGSRYALHWYYQRHTFADVYERIEFQGGVEYPDGRREPIAALVPDLAFRDDNRRFLGGTLRFLMPDGSERPVTCAPVSDTGFHLGAGLYHGFDGQWHGQWHGARHVEGEHLADCSVPEVARRVHQHRDCVITVDDPMGGGTGWGNLQSIVYGAHPTMDLTEQASFL
ncbi:MAG: hypothetical protein FJW88_01665 [Actinobacteria bacterium]|nr:hypothetical protein [Actinomycetota bacterium]